MAKHHYHVIQSEYGDPLDRSLLTLADVRKAIQSVLRDFRNDSKYKVTGNGSGLWYRVEIVGGSFTGDIDFLSFDDCTDDDCQPIRHFEE